MGFPERSQFAAAATRDPPPADRRSQSGSAHVETLPTNGASAGDTWRSPGDGISHSLFRLGAERAPQSS